MQQYWVQSHGYSTLEKRATHKLLTFEARIETKMCSENVETVNSWR